MSVAPLIAEPSFRLATESDVDTLLPFMCDYYAFDGHAFDDQKARAALITLLRDPNLGRVWLILADTTGADKKIERELPVGYIVLCFGYSLEWLGRDAFVDEFYLLPDYRGRGWGRKTMAFLEDSARSLNVTALHLEVMHHNTNALELYRKLGFEGHKSSFLSKWIAKDFFKPKRPIGT
ncbi:MAG: N-acetyltransferase [Candidatus Sulfotelmatobacter sp.]